MKIELENEFLQKCNKAIESLVFLQEKYEREDDDQTEAKRLKAKVEGIKLAKDYYLEFKKLDEELP